MEKEALFILECSISSKLFFPETLSNLSNLIIDTFISSKLTPVALW